MGLAEAGALGRIKAPGFLTDPLIRQAYLGSEWIGPSQGMLDPTKEIQAAVLAIQNGLSTHEQEAIKLNGSEFTTNIDKLAIENQKILTAAGQQQITTGQQIDNAIREIIKNVVEMEVQKQNEEHQ